jgi:hypothetical protein
MGLTRKISSNVDSVSKVQTEYDPLLLVGCAAAFALLEFFGEVVAGEDAAKDTS